MRRSYVRVGALFLGFLGMLAGASVPASALPIFAHQYGITCQTCHSAIPALNAFGRVFLANGYHLPGVKKAKVAPIAVKLNLVYSSAPEAGLPKAVVDEIELLTAGTVGSRGNYFFEQYAVDGGVPGNLRDAWFGYTLAADDAHVPVFLRAGQFTLPLPLDPESFRETFSGYAVFTQTIGTNPFNFFDPKDGISARVGHAERGVNFEFSALNGHDVQSGIPTSAVDTMAIVHEMSGPFDVSAYRYAGQRAVDRFTRTGIGVRFERGPWTSESVIQENGDTNAGFGAAVHSSGGFTQLRYAITDSVFGLVRYGGTNNPSGFSRSTTALVGFRLAHNSRLTIEDVVRHAPTTTHTINTQLTVAY